MSLPIYEPAEFVQRFLGDRLKFNKSEKTIALHVPCSSQKLGVTDRHRQVAERCVERVIVPDSVGCCGFAGDRGFNYPELTESALGSLKVSLPPDCHQGYCTSRTCEVGLSIYSGIPYQSIVYLLDECTEAVETDWPVAAALDIP